jgi:phosphoribosyl-ATP pyrophosphohydrolase
MQSRRYGILDASPGNLPEMNNNILQQLAAVLEQRKSEDPQSSYVSSLYARGLDVILKKIGEEAAELIIAAKGDDPSAVIHETADLWFHTLVLLAACGLGPAELFAELERRFGQSGLVEKARRQSEGKR